MMSSQAVGCGFARAVKGSSEANIKKTVTASVLLNKPNTKMPYMGEGVHTV